MENNKIKYEQIKGDQKSPFKIIHIKISAEHPGVDMHWHRSLEFLVPKSGAVELWSGGQTTLISNGSFAFINSKDIHMCRNGKKGDGYDGYCIQMRYDFFKEMGVDFAEYSFSPEIVSRWEIKQILDEIIRTYEKEGNHHYRYLGLAYLLLDELMKTGVREQSFANVESDKYRNLLVDILGYIEENSSQNLNAVEIAKTFNLSYGYLARLFNKYLGISIMGAINNARLEKAQYSLMNSDLSVMAIAMEEGFPNVKSFEREFKKQYGMTPATYRKKRS